MYEDVFKSYDVRGVVPKQLNKELVYKIGRAFVKLLDCKKVYVGNDMRESAEELKKALIEGITDQGADVVDVGMVSTDMIYYASGNYNSPGIMMTASHNPKEYNGLKFCKAGAEAIGLHNGLDKIKEMIEKDEVGAKSTTKGDVEKREILDEYLEKLLSFIDKNKIKKLRIAVDAGNGMAGKLIPALEKKLPQLDIIPLYFELDGSFPNHPPNPIDLANIQDLITKIKETKADLGLAFDGDADRVYLVDDNADFVTASMTGAMVAKAMLKKKPGSKIVYNVVSTWIVPETIKKYGGIPIETKVGHSIIKPIMKKEDAIFGTEHSGHYFFKDLYYADSGLLSALFILELISEQSEKEVKISNTLEEFRTYHAIMETNTKVESREKVKEVLDSIAKKFKKDPEVVEYTDIDGIRVDFKDWWFNVRPSNTEPLLRLNLEAKTPELMEQKKEEMIQLIKELG